MADVELTPIRVRAKGDAGRWTGFHGMVRVRGGDVFTLRPIETFKVNARTGEKTPLLMTPEMQFSPKWMERVDPTTPETRPAHLGKVSAGPAPKATIMEATSMSGAQQQAGGSVI